jgi:hypothetical protein
MDKDAGEDGLILINIRSDQRRNYRKPPARAKKNKKGAPICSERP